MYEQMKQEIIKGLEKLLPDYYTVKVYRLFKGEEVLEAFLISNPEKGVSPTFYFKDYFEKYCQGVSIDWIVFDIYAAYTYLLIQIAVDEEYEITSLKTHSQNNNCKIINFNKTRNGEKDYVRKNEN